MFKPSCYKIYNKSFSIVVYTYTIIETMKTIEQLSKDFEEEFEAILILGGKNGI